MSVLNGQMEVFLEVFYYIYSSPVLRRSSRVILFDTNTLTGEHEKDQSQSHATSNIRTTTGGRLWLQVVSIFFILLSDLTYTGCKEK